MGRVGAPVDARPRAIRCAARAVAESGRFRPRGVLPWGRRWGVVGGGRRGRWEVVGGVVAGFAVAGGRSWEAAACGAAGSVGRSDRRSPPGDERQFTAAGCRQTPRLDAGGRPSDERRFTAGRCRSNATLRRRAAPPSDERRFTAGRWRSNAMVLWSASADGDRSLGPARTDVGARGRARRTVAPAGRGRRSAAPGEDGRSARAGEDGQSARADSDSRRRCRERVSRRRVPCRCRPQRAARARAARRGRDGAAAIRPPWRSAMPAAIASPRPRVPRPARGRRTSSATGAGRPRPLSVTSIRSVPPSARPRTHDLPSPVLDRVRDQIARCLGEPHPVAPGRAPSARPARPGAGTRTRARARARPRRTPSTAERRRPAPSSRRPPSPWPPLPRSSRASAARLNSRSTACSGRARQFARRATRARSRAAPR